MINEVYQLDRYLNGQDISKDRIYNICKLMIRAMRMDGMEPIEIRKNIFKWGKTFDTYIPYSVNSIIEEVFDIKNDRLIDDPVIITIHDIKFIRSYGMKRENNIRLVLLAMLCYSKVHSDIDGEFSISGFDLSFLTGIDRSNIVNRYISKLQFWGAIEKLEREGKYTWDKHNVKAQTYKIKQEELFGGSDKGVFTLQENDIKTLYDQIMNYPF